MAGGTRDLDGAIVDVLALIFDPAPRSTVAKAISSAGQHRSLELPDLHARLQVLTEAGALVAAGGSEAVAQQAGLREQHQAAAASWVA